MAQDSSLPEFWSSRYRDHVTPWEASTVPVDLRQFGATLPAQTRVLVPGCGSSQDVIFLADAGLDVLAIDFSPEAVAAAQQRAGKLADRIQLADFFAFDPGAVPFDVIYERA